jgi:capsular polysaccharide biosynthesis protein
MELPDIYRALWRRKLMIVVLTCLLAGAAYVFTKRETPMYTATSLVRVQQQVTNADQAFAELQTAGRLAQTYVTIAQTSTIARGIAHELAGKVSYGDIAGTVKATQVQDLDMLNISATSPSPEHAALIANAAPLALRDFVRSTGTLHDEVITVQPASVPTSPSSPDLKLNVLIAIVLGLILNCGLALALDAFADRVSSPSEIERLTGIPLLAIIPSFGGDSVRGTTQPSSVPPSLLSRGGG